MTQRTFPKLKEIDDVLGGEESWKNVDATDGKYVCVRVVGLTISMWPSDVCFS